LNGTFSERSGVVARVAYSENYADEDYQSYKQVAANLALSFGFDIFAWKNWVFAPFAGASLTKYAAPDPNDPQDTMRKDFQWNVGANLEMPLTERASLGMQVQYIDNESTRARFTYDNLQLLFGPVGRF